MITTGFASTTARFFMAAVALMAGASLLPSPSYASTAAGTKISNIAAVRYSDSAGVDQGSHPSNQVDVTVTLVAATVNINRDIATVTQFEGTNTLVTYTVWGASNGKDTYNITRAENVTGGTFVAPVNGTIAGPNPITLAGTTIAVAAAGVNTITVPLDSTVGFTATGLVAGPVGTGTLLRIGAATYTVTAIVTNAGANTMDLTLSAVLAAPVAVGDVIGEQKTFTVSYPTGTLSLVSTGQQTATATVTSATDVSKTVTSPTTVITVNVNPATLSIVKSACTGALATVATGAPGCFAATANAAPGGQILYKVVITNTGSGVAKLVTITDTLQKYLTYVMAASKFKTGATGAGAPSTLNYNDATFTALTEEVSAGFTVLPAGVPSATLRRNITYALPIDLPASNELVLFYEATVD